MKSKIIKNSLTLLASLGLLCGSTFANDKLNNQALNYVTSDLPFFNTVSNNSEPNSVVILDFSVQTAESWDTRGKPNNLIENCINGSVITGFKWTDVKLETVGNSFFSEATMHFTNSSGSGGAKLYVGFGNESTGVSYFSSNGIFDLTDNSVSDVTSTTDQKFLIEFYESVDDESNNIDARYTSGTVEVHGIDLTAVENCPFISTQALNSDLSVTVNTDSSVSQIGDEVNLLVKVLNSGQAEASNVKLEYSLPNQLEYFSSNCSDGSNGVLSENNLSFNLQNINQSASVSCNIVSRVVGHGRISNSFLISSDNDSNSSNNSSELSLSGSVHIIPVNNWLGLGLLFFALIFVAKTRLRKVVVIKSNK